MNTQEFKVYVQSLGLRIGTFNIVSIPRKGDVFAFTNANTIMSVDGAEADIGNISNVSVNEKSVELFYLDGTSDVFSAGRFDPVSISRIAADSRVKRMPKTDSALDDAFPILYPDYRRKMYYDVIMEREMYDPSLFDDSLPEGRFIPFDEEGEYRYYQSIERRLDECGYDTSKTFPTTSVRLRVLITRFYENKKNRFLEWLKSLVWDGIPRVDTMFQTLFSARAPPLESCGLDDLYLAKLARAWLMGAVKRAEMETKHEVVPVLIGSQGQGKSSVLQYLAVRPEWFSDSIADVSTAQGVSQFLDGVRGAIIVEMSESKMIRSKDQEALKAFISKSSDQYRKPYARRDASYPRHFIMAATSNLEDVFTDVTGNRRYYPVICNEMDFSKRTPDYVAQLWAEAYQMHLAGEVAYIPQSWPPAIEMQNYSTQENPRVSTISGWLDHPDNGLTEVGSLVWREKVMSEMFHYGPSDIPSPEHENAWRAWIHSTSTGWVKMPTPIRVNGRYFRAWKRADPVISRSYEGRWDPDVIREGAKMIDMDMVKDETGIKRVIGKPLSVYFNELCEMQGIKDENVIVNLNDTEQKYIDALLNDGFIYMDDKGEFRTVAAPWNKDIYD